MAKTSYLNTKAQLVEHFAKANDLNITRAKQYVESMIQSLMFLSKDGLKLQNFGLFYISDVDARRVPHPQGTGASITIEGYKAIRFRPGKRFKSIVNGCSPKQ